jgi:hypothetical protein
VENIYGFHSANTSKILFTVQGTAEMVFSVHQKEHSESNQIVNESSDGIHILGKADMVFTVQWKTYMVFTVQIHQRFYSQCKG